MENSNRITPSQMPAFPAWLKKKPGTAPASTEEEKKPGTNDEAVAWALSRRRLKASANGATTYNVPSGFGFAAFVDHDGPPAVLTTDKDDLRVAEGMVATAIEKGWSPIHVDGTPKFKSQVFRSAALLGVQVTGYNPTPEDMKWLKLAKVPVPARFDNQIQPAAPTLQEEASPAQEQQQQPADDQVQNPGGEGMIKSLAPKDPKSLTPNGSTWENASFGQKLAACDPLQIRNVPKKLLSIFTLFTELDDVKDINKIEEGNEAKLIRTLVAQGENPWDYGMTLSGIGYDPEGERKSCKSVEEATEMWLNYAAKLEGDNSDPYTAKPENSKNEAEAAKAKRPSSSSPSMSM